MKLLYILTLFSVAPVCTAFAQAPVFDKPSPGSQLVPERSYSSEEGKRHNPSSFYTHPDFGKLTFDAPLNKRVAEDLSKRTLDERYYVDLDNPVFFYIQKASKPINFYKNGLLRAIDPTLHQDGGGMYISGAQPCPTSLNLNEKLSSITLGTEEFRFNNYTLKVVHNDNSVSLHTANWSAISVGNNGAYITDVFPGIDMQLVYGEASVESDFIIRENLHVKQLIFTDHLGFSENLNPFIYSDDLVSSGPVIFDDVNTGEAMIKIGRARCHDASENKHSWITPYTLSGNLLEILCDSARLNDTSAIYPITIDPLVAVIGPIASPGALMGSRLSPAFCSNTIAVNFPGGTTPWDVSAFWNIYTDFCADLYVAYGAIIDCYRSEAQVWITSSCGGASPVGAPGTIWTCLGCGSYGEWSPTLPFASSGTQTLAQCYTPSCSPQTLNFTINSNRSYCTSVYGYDLCNYASSYCNSMINWNVTVQGRNAETLSNTATGNGAQTIANPSCVGNSVLNPTPAYGVGPYTYNWSTGATSPTISVANTSGVTTCQVTDACGMVRTATFTVTCPLGVELAFFKAANNGTESVLSWMTSFERDNDYFSVNKAGSDGVFTEIAQVKSKGDSGSEQLYEFNDKDPVRGINYYKIKAYDKNGEFVESEIRSAVFEISTETITVVPNPNNGTFGIIYNVPGKRSYPVRIISAEGKVVYEASYALEKGNQLIRISVNGLQTGTYTVKIGDEKAAVTRKMIIGN